MTSPNVTHAMMVAAKVVCLRHEGRTFVDIARRMGVSRSRAAQIYWHSMQRAKRDYGGLVDAPILMATLLRASEG